jgi:hypothetical protein
MDNNNLIEDIITNKNEPTAEEIDTFKVLVSDWFKYDDAIRKLKIAIRERKTLQQVLNNKIEEFMFKYNYNDLNTQNGRLKTNIRNVHKPINIKDIREIINENKHLTGEELLIKIFNKEDRPVIVKKSIKRIIPKVSMSLDI